MISDGELRQMIREGEEFGYSTIVEALFELEAYRKALSEPVAYEWETNTGFGVSKEIPKIPEDCYISIKALYRKPTIPEREI